MRLSLLLVVSLTALAFGGPDSKGHMHGPDGRHVLLETGTAGPTSFVVAHHDLSIKASDGTAVLDARVLTSIAPKATPDDAALIAMSTFEPENNVYAAMYAYTKAGEYQVTKDVEFADGREFSLQFPIYVLETGGESAEEEHPHGPGVLPIFLGLVVACVGLYGAFVVGKRSARKGSGIAGVLVLAVAAFSLSATSSAGGEEAGHMHGPDGRHVLLEGAAAPTGGVQFRAFTTPDQGTTATQTVDGVTFTLTIENEEIAPNLDLVAVTPEQAELIGLQTVKAEVSDMGTGLQATGRVSSNPDGSVSVNARVGGRVVSLGALPGSKVRRGQALVVLESPELAEAQSAWRSAQAEETHAQAGLTIAQSGVAAAKAEAEVAERELARQKSLAAAGEFASPSLEAARKAESEARAAYASARSEHQRLQSTLERQRRGQAAGVVAVADLERTQAEFMSAQAAHADAEVRLEVSQSALAREEAIASQGLRNAKEIEAAQARLVMAQSGVRSAQNRQAQATADVARTLSTTQSASERVRLLGGTPGGGSRTTLTAPIDAVVETRRASVGQTVAAGEPLFNLLNNDSVWVTVDVFEKDLPKVRVGQSLEVVSEAYPDRVYEGRVASIQNLVNPETRTTQVQVAIDNAGGYLKRDMFVQVLLASGDGEVVMVPSSAIQRRDGLDYVFVQQSETAYRRQMVRVVMAVGDRRVVQGLENGSVVATTGSYQLLSMRKDR